jgi:hypothetical protein
MLDRFKIMLIEKLKNLKPYLSYQVLKKKLIFFKNKVKMENPNKKKNMSFTIMHQPIFEIIIMHDFIMFLYYK